MTEESNPHLCFNFTGLRIPGPEYQHRLRNKGLNWSGGGEVDEGGGWKTEENRR